MVVIYAEKNSLAKVLATALNAGKRKCLDKDKNVGYYEFKFKGEDAVICHGVGHLASLVPAKNYDTKYEKWDIDIFPCVPEQFRQAPKSNTVNCLKLVKFFFDKADWIINATDADREGELIFSYVYNVCRCNAPFKRVWLEDLTDEKINYAFNNLKSIDEPLSKMHHGTAKLLSLAGQARDIADWLIGINLTVASTIKYGNGNLVSLGRVQTPTLALVVKRELEIRNHIKKPYWKLTAEFSSSTSKFEAEYINGNFESESEADRIYKDCIGRKGVVREVIQTKKTVSVPLLYNTTQLQIAASKLLNWDAEKTTKIMQQLYEKKLMSYPRTSTEHLTDAMKPEVAETIKKLLMLSEYRKYSLDKWADFSKRHFDDGKVGSHTAIIPTVSVPNNLSDLSEDERLLYDLIAKSLIRIIYPKCIVMETKVKIAVSDNFFKATGNVILSNGWCELNDSQTQKKELPELKENDELSGEYKISKGVTEPPKRYTEAELLNVMETAGQKIDDEEIRTMMKLQKKGLGTDATRVPIIKMLYDKGYMTKKGKTIYPTEKGIYIINTIPLEQLKSANITGELEKTLNDIALGEYDYDKFIKNIKQLVSDWYKIIANSDSQKFEDAASEIICPLCKNKMKLHDWGIGCSGYKNGCKMSLNRTISGKKLTDAQLIMLIEKKKTNLIKGFISKNEKKFDAYLILNKENKIQFEFKK